MFIEVGDILHLKPDSLLPDITSAPTPMLCLQDHNWACHPNSQKAQLWAESSQGWSSPTVTLGKSWLSPNLSFPMFHAPNDL